MTERVVSVELRSKVEGFVAGFRQARKAASDFNDELQQAALRNQEQLTRVGTAATVTGLAIAAAAGLAIKKWADFDQAMSAVQAATHETEGGMRLLEAAALDAGARTVFSATEAANAIEELAKAGVETKDILAGGLDGALDLAAAGGLGVADAAGIAATALKTFKLEGKDMSHVADLLAAGAGKAMGDVTDLSAALNQSSMVAAATGLSIEETTAGLAAFAAQGLLGSDAGTSFKSMLQSLTPTSGQARKTMDELGISAFDAQGNFIGLTAFAGNLRAGLKDLSVEQQQAALKTIFGSDAIRAATVLYSEGAEGIQEWIDKVNDEGYAADTAAKRLDNLKGDLEALSGAFETALIKTGSAANDGLRDGVQWLTEMVDAYNELPPAAQSAVMTTGLVIAGVGLLSGALMLGTLKVAEFKVALATLGVTGPQVRAGLRGVAGFLGGPWGVALMAAGLAVVAFNKSMAASTVTTSQFETAVKQGESAFGLMESTAKRNANIFVDATSSTENLGETLRKLSIDASDFNKWITGTMPWDDFAVRDSLNEYGVKLGELAQKDLPAAAAEFQKFGKDAKLDGAGLTNAIDQMPAFKSALIDVAKAEGVATNTGSLLAIAMGYIGPASQQAIQAEQDHKQALAELQGKAQETGEDITTLADQIRGFGSATLDVRAANRQLKEAFDQLQESVAQNGTTLNTNTEQGRQNEAAIDAVAKATLNASAATLERTGSEEKASAVIGRGRERLIDLLGQFRITGKAAERYADKLGLIPENVNTAVKVETSKAEADLQAFIDSAPKFLTVQGQITWAEQRVDPLSPGNLLAPKKKISANGNLFDQGRALAFANGGFPPAIYAGRTGALYKFAEPETRWEAFISGKPGMEARNTQVWAESGSRLGAIDALAAKLAKAGGGRQVSFGNVSFNRPTDREGFREFEDTVDRILRER